MEQRYIEELCKDIVKRFGHKVETTNDFNKLSEDIYKRTNIQISESTLKRMWGYVSDVRIPRKSTLDILAKYTGYNGFDRYKEVVDGRPDWGKYQLEKFSEMFRRGHHSIFLKQNPKYCGNIETPRDGVKIFSPSMVRSPFIRYRDVLDYRYIIRTMTGEFDPFYDKEDPVIIRYDTLEDMISDGWESD